LEKLEFIDSKFRLAIIAAKRAKQLVQGAKKKVDIDANNPLTIALEEIYNGKIDFQTLDLEEIENLERKQEEEIDAASELLADNDEPTAESLFGIDNNDSDESSDDEKDD
jgi:DNA-directed RNA polymerase subunit omega